MHTTLAVNKNAAKNKPEAILYYNSTKGCVDTANELLRCYSTTAASRRWPLAAFFSRLDIISLNAFVIATEIVMMQSNRRSFLISLGEQLCDKEWQRRLVSSKRMQFAQEPASSRVEAILADRKRTTCKLRQKNKTRQQCCNCKKYVCSFCAKLVRKACAPS